MYQRQLQGQSLGGDNLGNHTAEEDLDMDGNSISNVQHISQVVILVVVRKYLRI